MLNRLIAVALLAGTIGTVSGCRRPGLASRALTSQEAQWAELIRGSYPAWNRPYFSPVKELQSDAAGAAVAVPAETSTLTPILVVPASPAVELLVVPPDDTHLTPIEEPPPPATPSLESYTVKKGDTLSDIAERVLGSERHWRRIFELNRDVLDSPDRIKPGTVIKIPPRASVTP